MNIIPTSSSHFILFINSIILFINVNPTMYVLTLPPLMSSGFHRSVNNVCAHQACYTISSCSFNTCSFYRPIQTCASPSTGPPQLLHAGVGPHPRFSTLACIHRPIQRWCPSTAPRPRFAPLASRHRWAPPRWRAPT